MFGLISKYIKFFTEMWRKEFEKNFSKQDQHLGATFVNGHPKYVNNLQLNYWMVNSFQILITLQYYCNQWPLPSWNRAINPWGTREHFSLSFYFLTHLLILARVKLFPPPLLRRSKHMCQSDKHECIRVWLIYLGHSLLYREARDTKFESQASF